MAQSRCNERYLPENHFPDGLDVSGSLGDAIGDAAWILIAVPSHAFVGAIRDVLTLKPGLDDSIHGLAWASKGLEPGTGRFLDEAARRELGEKLPLAVITGPSFAREVAAGLPTAVTVGGHDPAFCTTVAEALHSGNFRAYTTDDITGAELGGAVKNVLAVATGISDGMQLGHNARAALMTRGLAEMMRLGRALGAADRTLTGLAGMGDLVLTCTGDLSRNRRLGLALGAGSSMDEAVKEIGQVVEGVTTSQEVWRLGREHEVEMPITEQVHGILHNGWDPLEALRRLLAREQKAESG
jgi:glycerol-3-phosphate dehydrogenase (NAD(P)+)